MQNAVIVVRPFSGHAVGTVITDEAELAKIASGEHVNHIVRIVLPAPAPASKKTGS